LNLEGFNIFSNNGPIAGQSVFHFHFHITPRYKDDKIRFVLELKKYADSEMKKYGDLIRRHITTNTAKEH
jgi:histidine triad (HIT) family protein